MDHKRLYGTIRSIMLLIFLILIIITSNYPLVLALSTYSSEHLYLRYEFEPIEFEEEFIPLGLVTQDIFKLLNEVSKELGLTRYRYKYILSIPVSPKSGGYEYADVCFFTSKDAYLEVEIHYTTAGYYEYITRLKLIGDILGFCSSIEETKAWLENVLSDILSHSNITLNVIRTMTLNVTEPRPIILLGFYYNSSIAFTVKGKVDPSTWSAITLDGEYYNDWYFTLPEASGDYFIILYSKEPGFPGSESTAEKYCSYRNIRGYSILYLVNFSSTYNNRYEVEGLGTIDPSDTVYGLNPGGIVTDLIIPNNLSVKEVLDALRRAGYFKFYVYRVYTESNTIRLMQKPLFHALQAYKGNKWTYDLEACSITKNNTMFPRVPIIFPRIRYVLPAIRIDHEYYPLGGSLLRGALLVYSKSYRVLLEAIPLSELGSGVLPADLRYALTAYGYEVVLWSAEGPRALGIRLVKAEGLTGRQVINVGSYYTRDYLRITGELLMITYIVFLPIILLGFRKYLAGLLLLAIGLSMISATFVKLLPAREHAVIYTSLNREVFIYLYSSRLDVAGTEVQMGNESCWIHVVARLQAPSWDVVSEQNAMARGRLLVNVSLSDPAVYELSVMINGSNMQCVGERARVHMILIGSKTFYVLRSQIVPGLILATLGLALSMVAYLRRMGSGTHRGISGFPGILSWHLRSNLLDITSVLLLPAYYLVYAMSPANCKLGGTCLGRSVEELALRASVMPTGVYLLASLYAVIVAALLFGYHIDSGIDRRFILLGISRLRLVASKLLALLLLVSVPLAAARVGVYILVEPSAGSIVALAMAALVYGVILALFFGGSSALASVLTGRPSYALLALIPAVVVLVNSTPAGRPMTYESLAFKLLRIMEVSANIQGLVYMTLAGIAVNVLLLLVYSRREL